MSDTIVACLTPAGAGAIATLAVNGPDAWNVCRSLFTPHSGALPARAEDVKPTSFRLGLLGGTLRDEVVLALRQTSPVPWVELHCHGGREVVKMLLELFAERGVREMSWREWFDRVEPTPIRAEAARQLAHAPTVRTAGILLDQYNGALDAALATIRGLGNTEQFGEALANLLRFANVGLHLTKPWRVVVAGAPNVGKSTLVNALAGYQRCIVSETPGTTRDVVTVQIALDGWPIELIDTAGMRYSGESLEEQGIALARREAETADLCLWVYDGSAPPVDPSGLAGSLLCVVNKADLPAAWEAPPNAVRLSARTGEGLQGLCERIIAALVPNGLSPGQAVPFTPELCQRLEEARRSGNLKDGALSFGR